MVVVLLAVTLGAVVMIFVYLVAKHCRKTKTITDNSEANTSGKTFIIFDYVIHISLLNFVQHLVH